MRFLITTVPAALVTVGVFALSGGCYNTDRSRQATTSLSTRLTEYRDEQDRRIRTLNNEYRDAFARLMNALDELSQAEVQQARDGDAQQIADNLIADGNASLRSRFRQAFAEVVREQRNRIDQADSAVAAVREGYLKSYTEARLELAKVNLVLKNLDGLAHDPSDAQNIKETVEIIKLFAKAYDDARKKADAAAASGTAAGS